MDLDLRDNVCIVTGSTGGIGLETARLLAAEGALVVTSGRRAEAPSVGEALHVPGDLGRAGEPERLVREVEERLGRVDCLVNNVGVAVAVVEDVTRGVGRLWHQRASYVRRSVPFRHARAQGGRRASTAGKRPQRHADYSVTKAAVFARGSSRMYAKDGSAATRSRPGRQRPGLAGAGRPRRPAGRTERQDEGRGARGRRRRASARPSRRAGGDRFGDRVPLLAASGLRHRRRVER